MNQQKLQKKVNNLAIQDDLHYKAFQNIFKEINRSLLYRGYIKSREDLDNFKTLKTGIYCTNFVIDEIGRWAYILVISRDLNSITGNITNTATQCVQIAFSDQLSYMYTRGVNDNKWTSWHRYLTDYDLTNLVSKSELEKLKQEITSSIPEVDLSEIKEKINTLIEIIFGKDTVDWSSVISKDAQVVDKIKNKDNTLIDFEKANRSELMKTYTGVPATPQPLNENYTNNTALIRVLMLNDMKRSEEIAKLSQNIAIGQTAQIKRGAMGIYEIDPISVEKLTASFYTATATSDAPKLYEVKGVEYLDHDVTKGSVTLKAGTYYCFTNFTNHDILNLGDLWGTTPKNLWFNADFCNLTNVQTLELNDSNEPWITLDKEDTNNNEA